ncbi:MAG: DNA replication/repair protein RecF [Chloroflexota bacterium]|nr:DNA replication/repair protein RecF [Chloroflexota bacterium]
MDQDHNCREETDQVAYISRLSLTNFRNLVELELDLPPAVSVFYGANAQGKTTLLEAIYLLAIARSYRAENEREVVNFQSATEGGQALVGGIVEKEGERLAVYVGYQSVPHAASLQDSGTKRYTVRKEIRVSRVRRTATELVGMVNAVLFTAEDIQLVFGPPSGRRRYLDILISQADNQYLKGLQRYQKVVQQRNQLLRLVRDGRAAPDELEFWDGELVREGAFLIWKRHEAMGTLRPWCAQRHGELSGLDEDFRLEYRPSVPVGEDATVTENNFREALASAQSKERATGVTAAGPHSDDFSLLINQVDMGTFASRGQARTIALTLRLAEAAYLSSVRQEAPIILLDDVLSEMDSSRRLLVLEQLTQYQQVLITTTDLEPVQDFFGPAASYFRVGEGKVSPVAYQPDGSQPVGTY